MPLLGLLRCNFIAFSEQVTASILTGIVISRYSKAKMCRLLGKAHSHGCTSLWIIRWICLRLFPAAQTARQKNADAWTLAEIFLMKQELILILLSHNRWNYISEEECNPRNTISRLTIYYTNTLLEKHIVFRMHETVILLRTYIVIYKWPYESFLQSV